MLETCIQKLLGSNLDQDTGYHDQGILLFSSVPPGKCQDSTLIRAWLVPSESFPIHNLSYHPTLYSVNTDSIVKYPTKE
jgi:hypothetical protein